MIKFSSVLKKFFILFLYWVAFEWTFLSLVQNIKIIYSVRIIIDFLPVILVMIYFYINPLVLSRIGFKIILASFFVISLGIISLLIEGENIYKVFINIGIAIRFVPLIILTQNIDSKFKELFLKNIKIIYWIQISLAIIQLVNKQIFLELFLPNLEIFDKITPSSYREFAINTTFINTIEFSFFIVSISIVYIFNLKKQSTRWVIFFCSLIVITLSLSTISIIAILIIGYYLSRYKQLYPILFLVPIFFVVIFNQSILFDFIGTKNIDAWLESSSKYSRLGYFTKLLPQFFSMNVKDILLGMGTSVDIINSKLQAYQNLPLILTYGKNNLIQLKDVYWISILISQGIVGIFLFIIILKTIYSFARRRLTNQEFTIIKLFIYVIILLGFFNQVLDIKGFSYVFWLTIGIFFNNNIRNEKIKSANYSS
jgi:hypothetical protein